MYFVIISKAFELLVLFYFTYFFFCFERSVACSNSSSSCWILGDYRSLPPHSLFVSNKAGWAGNAKPEFINTVKQTARG